MWVIEQVFRWSSTDTMDPELVYTIARSLKLEKARQSSPPLECSPRGPKIYRTTTNDASGHPAKVSGCLAGNQRRS